jgi:PKD repeat protein
MVGMNRSRLYLSSGCIVIVLVLLAAPVTGAMGPALGAVDIADNNIRMVVVGTKEECSAACDAEPACVAATFVLPGTIQGPDGHCYLKNAAAPQEDNFNCYSFVKLVILPFTVCAMSNPKADFGVTSTGNKLPRGFAPLVVQFTDRSTGAKGWSWDFGDGSAVSHEQNPVHTYTAGSPDGTFYDLTLTVTGSCSGETSTSRKSEMVRVFDNIGFLGLASTPGGASVSIDSSPVAGMTSTVPGEPLRLTPGSHTVRLTLDGYKDYTGTVTIVNGVVTQLAPVLEENPSGPSPSPADSPISATGSLQVTMVPEQGTYGTTVPSPQLPQGTVTPAATSIPAGMPASAGTGSLTVRSNPAGANVYLDGEKIGTTPVTVQDIAPGTRRLLLTLQGYSDISETMEIAAGSNAEANVTFTGKKAPGFAGPAAVAALAFALLVLLGRRKGR